MIKCEPTKIGVTWQYLTVEFWLHTGGAQRLVQVKVPMAWLLNDEVTDAMDTYVRRVLVARWSDSQSDVPLDF
jgi:hypothetical protein